MTKDMHDAFMEDICSNLEDDTPRLIYADWLEDNGEPDMGRFIRAQIKIKRCPHCSGRKFLCQSCNTLIKHVREYVLPDHSVYWIHNQPVEQQAKFNHVTRQTHDRLMLSQNKQKHDILHAPHNKALIYDRGFVSTVYCDALTWKTYKNLILKRFKTVDYVDLNNKFPTTQREYNERRIYSWVYCRREISVNNVCNTASHISPDLIGEKAMQKLSDYGNEGIQFDDEQRAKDWLSKKLLEFARGACGN